MKTIDIIGQNYFGKWEKTRTACRCIITNESKILLSYETETNQWMLPGGGLEENESDKECCIREVAEETGMIVEVSECMLEIDEYYDDWKWVNKYFIGKIVGHTEIKQTEREREVGMVPKWVSIDEIKGIFSKYQSYADTDEMRRGMYLREYTALTELI
jgi:ADP-ribose pyrophosphatase YjhB (NUDIX family)